MTVGEAAIDRRCDKAVLDGSRIRWIGGPLGLEPCQAGHGL